MSMRRLWLPLVTILFCTVGAGITSTEAPPGGPLLTTAAQPTPSVDEQDAAAVKVNQAMHAVLPNAQVSFKVYDRMNKMVLTSQDADRQVAAMSVVKLLIALDALTGAHTAAQTGAVARELHQMLTTSDDQVASDLWTAHGGPAIVTRMVSLLNLTGTRPPDDPGQWGDTLTTPQDVVTIYRYITDRLPNADQDLVLGALADQPKIAADGFDQYFGIPHGLRDLSWAVKQGWGTSGSRAVMNSTGLVGPEWRYIVVVLASAPAKSYGTLPKAVTAGVGELATLVSAAG